jgi:hypothetical protein
VAIEGHDRDVEDPARSLVCFPEGEGAACEEGRLKEKREKDECLHLAQ